MSLTGRRNTFYLEADATFQNFSSQVCCWLLILSLQEAITFKSNRFTADMLYTKPSPIHYWITQLQQHKRQISTPKRLNFKKLAVVGGGECTVSFLQEEFLFFLVLCLNFPVWLSWIVLILSLPIKVDFLFI